jgi:dTDP-4-dehydrorhamnose 3,5-epimerase
MMNRFISSTTPLSGLSVVEYLKVGDERGYLARLFCVAELGQVGWSGPIAQINHTYTELKGTVRGMHYQRSPHTEIKLVTCLHGEIMDIVVDLRCGSPTFLKWHAELLSSQNRRALLIPKGFAHGYQTLSADVELLYCHSEPYMPQAEAGLNVSDPSLGIEWPLPITVISKRDASHPFITKTYKGVVL